MREYVPNRTPIDDSRSRRHSRAQGASRRRTAPGYRSYQCPTHPRVNASPPRREPRSSELGAHVVLDLDPVDQEAPVRGGDPIQRALCDELVGERTNDQPHEQARQRCHDRHRDTDRT